MAEYVKGQMMWLVRNVGDGGLCPEICLSVEAKDAEAAAAIVARRTSVSALRRGAEFSVAPMPTEGWTDINARYENPDGKLFPRADEQGLGALVVAASSGERS